MTRPVQPSQGSLHLNCCQAKYWVSKGYIRYSFGTGVRESVLPVPDWGWLTLVCVGLLKTRECPREMQLWWQGNCAAFLEVIAAVELKRRREAFLCTLHNLLIVESENSLSDRHKHCKMPLPSPELMGLLGEMGKLLGVLGEETVL